MWGSFIAQHKSHLLLLSMSLIFLNILINLEINNIFQFSEENIKNQFEKIIQNPGIGIPEESIEKIEENFVPGFEYKW